MIYKHANRQDLNKKQVKSLKINNKKFDSQWKTGAQTITALHNRLIIKGY